MANKNSNAKKIDLSALKKINFAKIKRLKGVNIISKIAIYFVLICIGFIFLEPIFEMISKSIMTAKDLIDPSITWIAKHATFDNFKNAISTLDVPASLLNSIWFSALLAIAQTAVSAMTGFALSRYTFKGHNFWFVMLIIAFILPVPLLTVPRIILFGTFEEIIGIKLINSIVPQFLMALLGQGAYSTMLILIFYNFFNMIPKSLDEAAMIDGAGRFKRMWYITIPSIKPTLMIMVIFAISGMLNNNFTQIYVFQNSLNISASQVIDTYIYEYGLRQMQFGVATAVNLVKSVIAMVLLLGANKISNKLTGSGLF